MKLKLLGLTCICGTFLLAIQAAAQLVPGNLEVLQIGNGSAALSSAGQALFIDQFNTTALNQTPSPLISIPTDGTGLVLSGSASSEGALTLSSDGSILTFGGYAASAGTASVASGNAAREVGRINAAGQFSVVANSSTALSGNNIRGAVSDGQNYWITSPNGLFYQNGGGTSLSLIASGVNSYTNTRVANLLNGSLYYSTSSGTHGIYAYAGMPTSTATPSLLFGTGSSSSPYDFSLNAAGNTAYVADDDSAASGGGVQKWVLSGGTWTLSYTIALGSGSAGGARQMTVDWTGADPIIYATTTESSANRLVEVTDTGAGSTFELLATAANNTVFRGVDFAPVPEPSALALIGLGLAGIVFRRRRG